MTDRSERTLHPSQTNSHCRHRRRPPTNTHTHTHTHTHTCRTRTVLAACGRCLLATVATTTTTTTTQVISQSCQTRWRLSHSPAVLCLHVTLVHLRAEARVIAVSFSPLLPFPFPSPPLRGGSKGVWGSRGPHSKVCLPPVPHK